VLPRRLVLLFAVGCGLSAGDLYYAQPILPQIQKAFHSSAGAAALVVAAGQLAYAIGLVAIVPLGDVVRRKALIPSLLVVAAAGLAASAAAPALAFLAAAAAVVGLSSVVAQVLVPFAASLASPAEQSRVVGTVMGGLLTGILLVRVASGLLANAGGWRLPYAAGAGAIVLLAVAMRALLPDVAPAPNPGYRRTVLAVGTLVRDQPLARRRCTLGALDYVMFNLFWSTMAFVFHRPPYRYSPAAVGLLGLVGAGGAAAAAATGRLRSAVPDTVLSVTSAGLSGGAFLLMALGRDSLAAMLVGMVALDVGIQALHITNSALLYERAPAPPSRIAAAYISSYFLGGAAGTALGALLYTTAGWTGVCAAGVGTAVVTATLGAGRRSTGARPGAPAAAATRGT
jgi:predicted MFS family arabinose efflux permease